MIKFNFKIYTLAAFIISMPALYSMLEPLTQESLEQLGKSPEQIKEILEIQQITSINNARELSEHDFSVKQLKGFKELSLEDIMQKEKIAALEQKIITDVAQLDTEKYNIFITEVSNQSAELLKAFYRIMQK